MLRRETRDGKDGEEETQWGVEQGKGSVTTPEQKGKASLIRQH